MRLGPTHGGVSVRPAPHYRIDSKRRPTIDCGYLKGQMDPPEMPEDVFFVPPCFATMTDMEKFSTTSTGVLQE